jgi:hypothetical protein
MEQAGVRVERRSGCSAIDHARNVMASDALHNGFDSILFIDSDIGCDPRDALRILARPEPVIAGIYAKKWQRELSSRFAEGINEVVFGPMAEGLYPLQYAAAGFLRIRTAALLPKILDCSLP